jgi:hypothetical protein
MLEGPKKFSLGPEAGFGGPESGMDMYRAYVLKKLPFPVYSFLVLN